MEMELPARTMSLDQTQTNSLRYIAPERRRKLTVCVTLLRTPEPRNHPTLMRIEEVSIGGANVPPRRRERAAAQDLLPYKPFVVVFIEL